MKRSRRKCELIPVSVYEGTPPVEFEDNTHKYFKSTRGKGHYLKANRKTCNICAKTAMFVVILNYKRHNRVERFCREHAANYGELPDIPEIESKATKSVII